MHKHSTITDTPWDRAPVTESEETVVAAWHVLNTWEQSGEIAKRAVELNIAVQSTYLNDRIRKTEICTL